MTQTDFPFVSIVTPVYNGEKYLEECIQSVRAQTYQNWEYIILNNCSTDNTLLIAERHANEDSRIRIVGTETLLPLIQNHNHALRQIAPGSKYCKIVHADDMLLANCVEQMVMAAETHPTAGIVGSYCLWGKKVVSDGIPLSTTFFPGRELGRLSLLNSLYCFWSPSSLLVRSDLIRKRKDFYRGDHLYADDEACYDILQESDFAFVHQVLTFIRQHDESATETMTASYNKIMLSNLDIFLKYGPIYLSAEEYDRHAKVKTNQYYRYLAASLFELREKAFWRYHKKTLQEMGLSFSRRQLIQASLSKMVNTPPATLKKLAGAMKRSIVFSRRNNA